MGWYIVLGFLFVHSLVHVFVLLFASGVKVFALKVYKTSYFEDSLMDFIYIWPDGTCRYRSKVFISTIPTPGGDLGFKVMYLELP